MRGKAKFGTARNTARRTAKFGASLVSNGSTLLAQDALYLRTQLIIIGNMVVMFLLVSLTCRKPLTVMIIVYCSLNLLT